MRPTPKLDQVFFLGRGAAPPFASVEAPPGIELVSRLQQVAHGWLIQVLGSMAVERWSAQPVAASDSPERDALQQLGVDRGAVRVRADGAALHRG